jgi:hypothetical protein
MPNPDLHHLPAKPLKRGRRAGTLHHLPLPTPLSARQEPLRRVLVPGLLDASGEPVMGLALGHPHRPLLMALGTTLGTLANRGGGA